MKKRIDFRGQKLVANLKSAPVRAPREGSGGAASKTAAPAAATDVFTMSVEELRHNAEEAKKEIAAVIQRRLPGLRVLTQDERKVSGGRLREGEDAALLGIARAAQAAPDLFRAWRDQGNDAAALADRLQRSVILGGVAASVTSEGSPIGDTRLIINEGARAPLLLAYPIAKDNAPHDPSVKREIVVTVDFYGAIGKKGARTRKANQEAAGGGAAKPAGAAVKRSASASAPDPGATPDEEPGK